MRKTMEMCSLKRSIIMSVRNAYHRDKFRHSGDTHTTKKYLICHLGYDSRSTSFRVTSLETGIVYPVELYYFYGNNEWEVYEGGRVSE